MRPTRLLPGLACFADTANVYVVRGDDGCVAIDFGSGRWLKHLDRLGWGPLRNVYLTHHHAEQCQGLLQRRRWPFVIHAPQAARALLEPQGVKAARKTLRHGPVPPSYDLLPRGIAQVQYDLAGWRDLFWGARRIRVLSTPGHGPDAVSILLDIDDRQVVFCGDAAHAGATLWQPYHLEWDHWTSSGALAAIEGVKRLRGLAIDLLCPSHGPVVRRRPRAMLAQLHKRLQRFADAKGHICPGQRDRYLQPRFTACGAAQLLPRLFQFGSNGYLLCSRSGEAMVIDPYQGDLPALDRLLRELPGTRVTAMTATHCHGDHVDGALALRRRGAKLWLHPQVAWPLADPGAVAMPWLPRRPIKPDGLLPEDGCWRWQEYEFRVGHYPGQTWWHAALMTVVDGRRVFFGGDSFQPASRWNGTGGFCSYNGSSFAGFIASARLIRRWRPQWVLNGHGTYQRFAASPYGQIERWARRAERATRALCPGGDLARHYVLHRQTLSLATP